MGRLRFRTLERGEEAAIRPLWNAWARRQRVSPFALFGFFAAWRATYASTRTAFLIVGESDGAPRFLLPMWHPVDEPGAWSSLGTFRADYTEAVAAADDAAIGREFWSWLEATPACTSAKVARFPLESFLGRTVPPASAERAGRVVHALRHLHPVRGVRYLSTSRHQEHAYADRAEIEEHASRVDSYDQRKRQLARLAGGPATYRVVYGRAIAPLLDTFFAMHVENFAGTERTSQFVAAEERAFYRALVESDDLATVVAMDVLEVHDRPVALHFGFRYLDRVYYYKPTFALDLAKASPGRILLAHVFARAKEDGVERVDLLKGAESYKALWARSTRTTETTVLIRRTPAGILQELAARWRA